MYTYNTAGSDENPYVCISSSRLRNMAQKLDMLAGLVEKLEDRGLPFTVEGGLIMSTEDSFSEGHRVGNAFGVRGNLVVRVPSSTQERMRNET